jgi:O-antigen/teichoic acid export membrane protein
MSVRSDEPTDAAGDPGVLDAPEAGAATLRGGALRVGAWTGAAALSLLSIPLLVRHLGVSEFGRYVTVLSIVNIAALASDLGLAGLALREWSAADPEDRPRVLRTLLGLRVAVALVGAVVALGFTFAAGYPASLVAGTAIALVGLFAQVFGDFALVGLAGSLRFGRVALVELTRSALGTIGIVALVVAGAGLIPFFAAYAVAAVISTALAIRLARGSVPLTPRFRRSEWRPLVVDTIAYAAAAAVYVVYFRVIMLVISIVGTANDAGLFATAYRIVEFTAAVGGVLAATVTPVLARAGRVDVPRLRRVTVSVVRMGILSGAFVAVVLAAGAPALMNLIGGESTKGAVAVLRIEAPAIAATFASFGLGAVLLVLRRYRELLTINVLALVVALAGSLVLVPSHGARGAAVAALAGELTIAIGQTTVLIGRVVPAATFVRPAAAAAAAAAAAIGVFVLLPLPNLVATVIAAAVFVGVVALLRQLPPELRELARLPRGAGA